MKSPLPPLSPLTVLIVSLAGILLTGGGPASARAAAGEWRGVVVIHKGTVKGGWQDPLIRPGPDVRWEQWEPMERSSRPEQLALKAVPDILLEPDQTGRCVLAVAPGAALSGHVIALTQAVVDIRGAEVSDTAFKVGGKSQVTATDSFLSSFHLLDLKGDSSVQIDRCAVTGPFAGAFIGGSGRLTITGTHFRECELPWVDLRSETGRSGSLTVRGCRFEQCFVPDSFLRYCQNCTFVDCVFGGVPGDNSPLQHGDRGDGAPAPSFWIPWTQGPDGARLKGRIASAVETKPVFVTAGEKKAPAPDYLGGRVFRRLDLAERLMFDDGRVCIMSGGTMLPHAVREESGRPYEEKWKQTFTQAEWPVRHGSSKRNGTVGRVAVFPSDPSLMVVLDGQEAQSLPLAVSVYEVLSGGQGRATGAAGQAVGTSWRLDSEEQWQLRFETGSSLIWWGKYGSETGQTQWRPGDEDSLVLLENGPGGLPAEVRLNPEKGLMQMISGNREWAGKMTGRDNPADFTIFPPEGGATPKTGPEVTTGTEEISPGPGDGGNPGETGSSNSGTGGGTGLKSQTSRMNGLLVALLPGGKTVGAASPMNATALPSSWDGEASLKFNQNTGPMMSKALEEVRKFMTVRHRTWPRGYRIEVSFADKYTPKDGPSAAVACALLLEGLYTGSAWDPAVAVTGDMNADGSVQPVGGVPAKIRGAAGAKCRIIGVPDRNARAVRDYMIVEGPQVLMGMNVVALKEFSQAADLASLKKSSGLTAALAAYEKIIQSAPSKERAVSWLKHPGVIAQLRKVVEEAPHHLSASLLLEYATARSAPTLSLAGSMEKIDQEAYEVLQAIRSTKVQERGFHGLRKDKLGDAASRLRNLRTRLHPDTRPLLDSMETFTRQIRNFLNNPPRTPTFVERAVNEIRNAGAVVDEQYQALKSNPEVVAELMKE